MTETRSSRTALGVAWLRAAHQVLDDAPLLLEDPAAPALFGADVIERLRNDAARLQSPGARALRSHVVLRSRFAEDRLALAVARGVRQYVILGAGYDTFSVRQPAWAANLRVTEVDQPATQMEKRARLEQAGLAVPDNVAFLSVDFEAESLAEAFGRSGLRAEEPAFFSWLGVTVYLTETVIDAVLATIAAYPPGSEIVLTFAPVRDDSSSGAGRPTLADRAAEVGEPWLTYLTAEAVDQKLRAAGFRVIEFLTPELAAGTYFTGRSDGLPVPARTSIVSAIR